MHVNLLRPSCYHVVTTYAYLASIYAPKSPRNLARVYVVSMHGVVCARDGEVVSACLVEQLCVSDCACPVIPYVFWFNGWQPCQRNIGCAMLNHHYRATRYQFAVVLGGLEDGSLSLLVAIVPETRRSTLLTMPGMSTKLRHCWQRLPTSLSRAMVPTSVHCVVLLPPEGWELQSTTRAGRPEQLLELQ